MNLSVANTYVDDVTLPTRLSSIAQISHENLPYIYIYLSFFDLYLMTMQMVTIITKNANDPATAPINNGDNPLL
jgi:hypothetical protein